ncbi:MAG: hypothetical protein ROO70_14725 [Labrenzia sp.]
MNTKFAVTQCNTNGKNGTPKRSFLAAALASFTDGRKISFAKTAKKGSAVAAFGVLLGWGVVTSYAADAAISEKETLHISCSSTPELVIDDEAGSNSMLSLKYFREYFKNDNLELEIFALPRKRALIKLKNREIDGLCGCLSDEVLPEDTVMSEVLGYSSVGIVFDSQNSYAWKLQDFGIPELKVGMVGDDHLDGFVASNFQISPERIGTQLQAATMLHLKRLDIVLVRKTNYIEQVTDAKLGSSLRYRELGRVTFHMCLSSKAAKSAIN